MNIRSFCLAFTLPLLACGGGGGGACPEGFVASGGVCLPDADAGPDAGVDATVPDAAAPDGATVDAAPDGTIPDAAPDGTVPDAAMADACVPALFYRDVDGDGFGDPLTSLSACEAPEGYVADDTDCDITRSDINPSASEICDGLDNDCSGTVDDLAPEPCGTDVGACVAGTRACTDGSWDACVGGVEATAEVCEGSVDENCNGAVDEGCSCTNGDTRPCGSAVGACSRGTQTCGLGSWGACEGAVGPSTETCNGVDDDCDGSTDEGNPGGGARCGSDVGACVAGVLRCTGGSLVCDGETGPSIEYCDGIDNDCDGSIDEGLKHIFYADCDGDTFGDLANSRLACNEADAAPFFGVGCGGTSDATDCDDSCATCHPGGVEVCNGVDDDCDGAVDEGVRTSYYRDGDGDGFGAGGALLACSTPGGGYVTNVADCDDGNRNAFPGQTAYFTRPRSDGSYDYDCNAANNPQYSSQNTCYNGGSCRGGWVSLPAPTCGSTANFYATCSIAGGGGTLCAPPPVGAIRQTQGCR